MIAFILNGLFFGLMNYILILILAILERHAGVKDPINPSLFISFIIGFIVSLIIYLG